MQVTKSLRPLPRSWTSRRSIDPKKAIVTALMLALSGIWIYPLFLTVITSLKTEDDIITNPLSWPKQFIFSDYADAWNALDFGHLLYNTILYAGLGSVLCIVLAIVPGYTFSRLRIVGGRTLFVLLLTTLMLPQQTVLIPLYDLLNRTGLLNTQIGLILVHGIYGMPFQLLLMAGFMANLPRELEDAARVDGCSDIGVLRHIVLPLSLPVIGVGFVLNFIAIWKEFIFALSFLNSQNLLPITTGILKLTSTQYFSSFGLLAAAVILAQIPMVIIFIFAHRWITQGIYAGALKG